MEECAWGPLTLASPGTGAFVGIDQVNAGAPVLARLGETLIDLVGAVGPHVSWHALREAEKKKKKKKKKPRRRRRKRGRQREKRGDSLINVRHEMEVFCLPGCFLASMLPRPQILYSRGD